MRVPLLCITLFLLLSMAVQAQCTYKFTNGGGNNEWSNVSNWALVSGGCAASAVPSLSDDVIIDVDVITTSGVAPNRINISNTTSGAKSIVLIGTLTGKGLFFKVDLS